MDTLSKSTCRNRATFLAQLADADIEFAQNRSISNNLMWVRPTALASVAQVWATLALSAPND